MNTLTVNYTADRLLCLLNYTADRLLCLLNYTADRLLCLLNYTADRLLCLLNYTADRLLCLLNYTADRLLCLLNYTADRLLCLLNTCIEKHIFPTIQSLWPSVAHSPVCNFPSYQFVLVCLNLCLTSQSTAMVMLGCCLNFMGLKTRMS